MNTPCGRCGGSGTYEAPCPGCDGASDYAGQRCAVCRGSGTEPVVCWHCDGTGAARIEPVCDEDRIEERDTRAVPKSGVTC